MHHLEGIGTGIRCMSRTPFARSVYVRPRLLGFLLECRQEGASSGYCLILVCSSRTIMFEVWVRFVLRARGRPGGEWQEHDGVRRSLGTPESA